MLNRRQLSILESTIQYHISTAEPVGSNTLVKLELFDVSSATIRSELKELEAIGYLTHLHTSSGRVPTDLGYRYYVDHLLPEYHLSILDKQTIKDVYERYFCEDRNPYNAFVSSASHFFSGLALVVTTPRFYQRGLSNMLHLPEFDSIELAKRVIFGLEQYTVVRDLIMNQVDFRSALSTTMIGREIPLESFHDCSMVLKPVREGYPDQGVIGFLGPKRIKYSKCFALLDYFSELLNFF